MNKRFKELVKVARRSDVPERLQLFGDMDLKAHQALDVDWLHVIEIAKTDALEAMRLTAPEDEPGAKRKLRRNLAIIVAACIEWESRL